MRLGLLMFALAACSASVEARPAWPKATVREVDGGESLAPRAAVRAITFIVEEDKAADKVAVDKPAASASVNLGGITADKSAAATSAAPSPDDPITTEDIVIEIED